jgi:hypothetical protein
MFLTAGQLGVGRLLAPRPRSLSMGVETRSSSPKPTLLRATLVLSLRNGHRYLRHRAIARPSPAYPPQRFTGQRCLMVCAVRGEASVAQLDHGRQDRPHRLSPL